MPDRVRLAPGEIERGLRALPGWTLDADRIRRAYDFHRFSTAMEFMRRGAAEAEALDHHPDWRNLYGKIWIELWTHDRGGVTSFDLELAARMERIANELQRDAGSR